MRLPEWVGDRDFLVIRDGKRVAAAFYTKQEAETYVSRHGGKVKDRRVK